MQVRISGGRGGGGAGIRFGGGGIIRSTVQSIANPENWLIDAVLLILVVIVIVLIVLIIREYNLQKKNKK